MALQLSRIAGILVALAIAVTSAAASSGCTNERPPPVRTVDASPAPSRPPAVEPPKRVEASSPHRGKLPHGGELYLPTWFSAPNGAYDLIVHFHGMAKLQEGNLDRSQINAAVVTINLGVGTDAYSAAFRDPQAFPRLLDEAQAEIQKSERVPGSKLGRIALSAWSAGFVSVSKIMSDPATAQKIDAVVLADGFFTSFTNIKKRIINTPSLERFVTLTDLAVKDEKLFVITHSSIPTVDYPSVAETVTKLLEMTSSASAKTPSTAVGPREMRETYSVDRGSFHVKGYEGVTAPDHVKQIQAMGETVYPYLKKRWDPR